MQGGSRSELLRRRKGKKGPTSQEEIKKMIRDKQRNRTRLARCCGRCRSSPYWPNTWRKGLGYCALVFGILVLWMFGIGAMYFEEDAREMLWKLPTRKLARRLGGHCDFDKVDISDLDEELFRAKYLGKKPVLISGFAKSKNKDFRPKVLRKDNYTRWYTKFGALEFAGSTSDLIPAYSSFGMCQRRLKDWFDEMFDARVNTTLEEEKAINAGLLMYSGSNNPFADYTWGFEAPKWLFSQGAGIFNFRQQGTQQNLYLGADGSGKSWQQHGHRLDGLFVGMKHWMIFPETRESQPGLSGYNSPPAFTSDQYLKIVMPKLKKKQKPLQCFQRGGEIMYVPGQWAHATRAVGDIFGYSLHSQWEGTDYTERLSGMVERFFNLTMPVQMAMDMMDQTGLEGLGRLKYDELAEKYLEEGLRIIDSVIELKPNANRLHFLKANVLRLLRGRELEAMKTYLKVAELDPFNVHAMVQASWIAESLQEREHAKKMIDMALKINPGSSLAMVRKCAFEGNDDNCRELVSKRPDLARLELLRNERLCKFGDEKNMVAMPPYTFFPLASNKSEALLPRVNGLEAIKTTWFIGLGGTGVFEGDSGYTSKNKPKEGEIEAMLKDIFRQIDRSMPGVKGIDWLVGFDDDFLDE